MCRHRERLGDVEHTLLELRREALYVFWNDGVAFQARFMRVMVPVATR